MITSNFLLNAVKSKLCVTSDYRLAKVMNMSKKTISSYRHHVMNIGEKPLSNIASILTVDECVLYAAIQAERSKDPSCKVVWLAIYNRLGGDKTERFIMEQCFPDELPEKLKVCEA